MQERLVAVAAEQEALVAKHHAKQQVRAAVTAARDASVWHWCHWALMFCCLKSAQTLKL